MQRVGRTLTCRAAPARRCVSAPRVRTLWSAEEFKGKLAETVERAKEAARNFDGKAALARVRQEVGEAYSELVGEKKRSVLKQSLRTAEDAEASRDEETDDAADNVHKSLMVVEQDEPWERLRERLKEAPIIQAILKNAAKLRETELGKGAQAVGSKLNDKVEDAREFWETSQNPLVYQASSIVDAMSAETEFATATRELRRLDPKFSLEEWRDSVTEEFAPNFVDAFIRGDTITLRPWLSDGLFSRLAHEIRMRKQEGLDYGDAKVLDCERCEILAAQVEDARAPILVAQFMTQQINCVRNREGDVIEGSPSDIRAYFYVMAFQRDYDEKESALSWRVIDFQLGGGEAYY